MPVLSTHVFANHKGGVGKSTLCFHLATAYAKSHPNEKVLVLDFTEVGFFTAQKGTILIERNVGLPFCMNGCIEECLNFFLPMRFFSIGDECKGQSS